MRAGRLRAHAARVLAPSSAAVFAVGLLTLSSGASAAAEVTGPHGVEGYRSAYAFFYVVPVDGGVVLVDTGFDATGDDVRAAVGGRAIKAVLITHSHVDHWSGVHVVGDAPVYASSADADAMRGTRHHTALINHIVDHQFPRPTLPRVLRDVQNGEAVAVGAERFVAHVVPGHTAGSVVWEWRDVLFTGDALLGDGDGVSAHAPPFLGNDARLARRSISRLWGLSATTLLDGHSGRTDDAIAKINRFLSPAARREEDEP